MVAGALTAHAAAATEPFETPFPVPEYPAAEMFERPAWLERGQGLTIMDDGSVAGYFHDGEGCIIGAPGCVRPTPSPTGYAGFHQQPQVLADGSSIRVGVIGSVGGHANPYVTASSASRHYADPNCQRIVCRAFDDFDERGVYRGAYIAGVLVPRVGAEQRPITFADVAAIRRCSMSGDWRPMEPEWFDRNGVTRQAAAAVEFYDCIGPTLVTRPGLALVRAYRQGARAAAVLGGLGGVQLQPVLDLSQLHDDPEGATMQTIMLGAGDSAPTTLEVPDGSIIESRPDGSVSVTVPDAPAAATAAADTPPTDEPPAPAAIDPEFVARVASIETAVHDRLIPFIDGCEAVAVAELDARRAALEAPVALPVG